MTLSTVLQQHRQGINDYLQQVLAQRKGPAARLQAAMQHALLLGGKRIRPFLTLHIGELCGAEQELLWRAAAALECIHSYSLVHDDLPAMDDDVLRRGQPTCHVAFDEATAILAGDALQTLAFELLSAPLERATAAQQLAMLQVLAQASGDLGMCGGQALDLQATGQQLDEPTLAQVHQHKTGALIIAAADLGVLAGNRQAQPYRAAFTAYAAALGLAFQVQDDILDVIGETTALGKTSGSDAAAAKATYVQVLGLAGAQQKVIDLHQKALHALDGIPYNTELLKQFADYLLTRDH